MRHWPLKANSCNELQERSQKEYCIMNDLLLKRSNHLAKTKSVDMALREGPGFFSALFPSVDVLT